VKREMKKLVRI